MEAISLEKGHKAERATVARFCHGLARQQITEHQQRMNTMAAQKMERYQQEAYQARIDGLKWIK